MTSAHSLSECAIELNRALGMRDFAGAQMWLAEYSRLFDRGIQGLATDEALKVLSATIAAIRTAQYNALAARSFIAAELGAITRAAPYRRIETRHAWELQG
jgi:hypothetical protein